MEEITASQLHIVIRDQWTFVQTLPEKQILLQFT